MTNDAISNEFGLDNRRAAPRVSVSFPLTQNGFPSKTINLSATGIRFVTRHRVSPVLDIDLNVGNDTLRLRGKTCWSQSQGAYSVVGAHFEPTGDLPRLRDLLYA